MKGLIAILTRSWLAALAVVVTVVVLATFDWLRIKTVLAVTMVAIGIDWPNIPDGDKINAVIGVGLGIVGITLSAVGAWVAVTQHRWLTVEKAKRVELVVYNEVGELDNSNEHWRFIVMNVGTKTLSSFNWRLSTDTHHKCVRVENGWRGKPAYKETWEGGPVHTGRFPEPLYPREPQTFATVVFDKTQTDEDVPESASFAWSIVSNEGTFSSSRPLRIRMGARFRPMQIVLPVDN